jgi:Tol biopolymer transport system component
MPSLISGYEYDIFISYRHKDNKSDGWVTEFVRTLRSELEATFKEDISIYFDENPHDGLLQHHEVDGSLRDKLRCLVFIPIVSQTYCDPKAFAWQHELLAFIKLATEDKLGLKTKVGGGNTASRVLPVRIHEMDAQDKKLFEEATGGIMRPIDFIYKEAGVNRPLRANEENPGKNQNKIFYRNQVNKMANAIKDIIAGLQGSGESATTVKGSEAERAPIPAPGVLKPRRNWKIKKPKFTALFGVSLTLAGVLFAFIAIAILHFSEAPPENITYKTAILLPENTNFANGGHLALSPDGRSLAFVGIDSIGNALLWVRPLQALKGQALTGTEGASFPFWSPDSKFIGFFAGGKLKKIPASGGAPQTLCDALLGRGGSWNADGTIIFCPTGGRSSLFRVPDGGGSPEAITWLDSSRNETTHRWPNFLPDGKHFLYLARKTNGAINENDNIVLGSLDTTFVPRVVVNSGLSASFANGYLLFTNGQTLMAQPFDKELLKTTGDAVPVAEDIQTEVLSGKAAFSTSWNGVLIYHIGGADAGQTLLWYDRTGKQLSRNMQSAVYWDLNLSPDGKKLATTINDPNGNVDVWLHAFDRAVWTRFTFDPGSERWPVWSPDGGKIAYITQQNNSTVLVARASNGAGSEELLLHSNFTKRVSDWSRNGRFIAYLESTTQAGWDIWILPLEGDKKPYPFLQTGFNEQRPKFSPDGRFIAYESNESGRSEIYIRPFPGPGGKWQVSTDGGTRPRWRDDGKELFYLSQEKIMTAEVKLGSSGIEVGAVKTLFHSRSTSFSGSEFYDVTGDGQRFILSSTRDDRAAPATLVVNWVGEIKK